MNASQTVNRQRRLDHSLLFDARLVLQKPTGIGRYITSLVPELLRLAPGLHVHLLRGPSPWPNYGMHEWEAPNLTQHVSPLPHMSLRQYLFLPRLAKQLGVDLVHYPHFDAPVYGCPAPLVVTIYDAKYIVEPEFFTRLGWLKKTYMKLCFAQSLKSAAAVLTISRATALDLQRHFRTSSNRLHVVHLAAPSGFRPTSIEEQVSLRDRYDLSRPFILSVGERRPHKNHVGLIQAYATSKSRFTHDLVIVGQAYEDYTEPETTVYELGLVDQIHFLSDVNPADLMAFYTAADLFVLVSFYEGFGLPVLEAMACGTPVIASNTTATGEVTGVGGVQVNPRNAVEITTEIDRLLEDKDLQRRQIEQGYAWQQRFSWQKTAKQTLKVYEQALKGPTE